MKIFSLLDNCGQDFWLQTFSDILTDKNILTDKKIKILHCSLGSEKILVKNIESGKMATKIRKNNQKNH